VKLTAEVGACPIRTAGHRLRRAAEHFTIADDGAEAEIVVVEPTGSETQVFAKLGGEAVVAVFRERHQFNPGDKIPAENQTPRWCIYSTRPPASV